MRYATAYHIGRSKAEGGVNEDSVGVSVFEDGHRDGYGSEPPDGDGSGPDTAARTPGSTRSAGVFVLADGAGGLVLDVDISQHLDTDVLREAPGALEGLLDRVAHVSLRNRFERLPLLCVLLLARHTEESQPGIDARGQLTGFTDEVFRDFVGSHDCKCVFHTQLCAGSADKTG